MSQSKNSTSPARSTCWTIAGLDPCHAAGIGADLKTFHALGTHGCSLITSFTAQNLHHMQHFETIAPALLQQQIHLLEKDFPPSAIKK